MDHSRQEAANLEAIRRLYVAIANGPRADAFSDLYAADVVQEEFPNRLLPHGARRDRAALREAMSKGLALMAHQTFELVNVLATGNSVAVEGRWTGTVAVDAGPFKAGTTIRARFAQVFDFRDGKVVAIRNYDCFDPG